MKRFRETDEISTLAMNFICNSIRIKANSEPIRFNERIENRLTYLLAPFYFTRKSPYTVYLNLCTFADIWHSDQGNLESGEIYFKVMKPGRHTSTFSWTFGNKLHHICFPANINLIVSPVLFS
jgi:hypothetical protein